MDMQSEVEVIIREQDWEGDDGTSVNLVFATPPMVGDYVQFDVDVQVGVGRAFFHGHIWRRTWFQGEADDRDLHFQVYAEGFLSVQCRPMVSGYVCLCLSCEKETITPVLQSAPDDWPRSWRPKESQCTECSVRASTYEPHKVLGEHEEDVVFDDPPELPSPPFDP